MSSARTSRELAIFPVPTILRRPVARARVAATMRSSAGTMAKATTTLSEWDITSAQGLMARNTLLKARSKILAEARILDTTAGHLTLGNASSMPANRWKNGSKRDSVSSPLLERSLCSDLPHTCSIDTRGSLWCPLLYPVLALFLQQDFL